MREKKWERGEETYTSGYKQLNAKCFVCKMPETSSKLLSVCSLGCTAGNKLVSCAARGMLLPGKVGKVFILIVCLWQNSSPLPSCATHSVPERNCFCYFMAHCIPCLLETHYEGGSGGASIRVYHSCWSFFTLGLV